MALRAVNSAAIPDVTGHRPVATAMLARIDDLKISVHLCPSVANLPPCES